MTVSICTYSYNTDIYKLMKNVIEIHTIFFPIISRMAREDMISAREFF